MLIGVWEFGTFLFWFVFSGVSPPKHSCADKGYNGDAVLLQGSLFANVMYFLQGIGISCSSRDPLLVHAESSQGRFILFKCIANLKISGICFLRGVPFEVMPKH